jgi:HEAT repeat protein
MACSMKFFVSYSRSVQDSVRDIIASLRDDGEDVWWDQDLRAGQDWWATILNNIEARDVCLFMISEKAVQSPYCMEELRYALARNRLVLPFVMDAPVTYTIPPEIMKGRIQFEPYSGRPNHLKDRIRITCKGVDWTQYKDLFAQRPPEPNTGTSNLADRLAKAIALAQEGVFDSAIEGFTDVAHNDHANFGDFCHTWIEKINRYKEVISLATHASMKRLALPKWAAFLKQYADDDPFDPLGVEEKLAIKKAALASVDAPASDELQKVYSLIEEVRKAHIEDLPFGADPALYALGDMGEIAVIPILALLQDDDARMRESAVNLLGNIGDERAIEPLIEVLNDPVWDVRWAACHMLPRFEDKRVVEPLIDMLNDPQAEVREMAVSALAAFEDPRAVEPLMAVLQDENEKVRVGAARALGELGYVAPSVEEEQVRVLLEAVRNTQSYDRETMRTLEQNIVKLGFPAVIPLIAALQDEKRKVRSFAAKALGYMGDTRAVEPLITILQNDWEVRSSAALALGSLKDMRAAEVLIAALQDKNSEVRLYAALALGSLKDTRAVEPLITKLKDANEYVRSTAARALGELGDKRAIPSLTLALKDENEDVCTVATQALEKIRAANPDA